MRLRPIDVDSFLILLHASFACFSSFFLRSQALNITTKHFLDQSIHRSHRPRFGTAGHRLPAKLTAEGGCFIEGNSLEFFFAAPCRTDEPRHAAQFTHVDHFPENRNFDRA